MEAVGFHCITQPFFVYNHDEEKLDFFLQLLNFS